MPGGLRELPGERESEGEDRFYHGIIGPGRPWRLDLPATVTQEESERLEAAEEPEVAEQLEESERPGASGQLEPAGQLSWQLTASRGFETGSDYMYYM